MSGTELPYCDPVDQNLKSTEAIAPTEDSLNSTVLKDTTNIITPTDPKSIANSNAGEGLTDDKLQHVKVSHWDAEELRYFCQKLAGLSEYKVPNKSRLDMEGRKLLGDYMSQRFPLAAKAKKFEPQKIEHELSLLVDDYINGFLAVKQHSTNSTYSPELNHFVYNTMNPVETEEYKEALTNEILNLTATPHEKRERLKRTRIHRMFHDDVSIYLDVGKFLGIDNNEQYKTTSVNFPPPQQQAGPVNQCDSMNEWIEHLKMNEEKEQAVFLSFLKYLLSEEMITRDDLFKLIMNTKPTDPLMILCTNENIGIDEKLTMLTEDLARLQ